MEWLLLGVAASALLGLYTGKRMDRFALAVAGDEDMKIATGSFSPRRTAEDAAQAEAELYLRQKKAGNVDKARTLGEEYAQMILQMAEELLPDAAEDTCAHQRLLLASYAVNRVIAEYSPNSILAQTSLNCFYDSVQAASPDVSAHIRDMAAFSLYILVDRSQHRDEAEIGAIFAQLCGKQGSQDLSNEGNRLYRDCYERCRRKLAEAEYMDL